MVSGELPCAGTSGQAVRLRRPAGGGPRGLAPWPRGGARSGGRHGAQPRIDGPVLPRRGLRDARIRGARPPAVRSRRRVPRVARPGGAAARGMARGASAARRPSAHGGLSPGGGPAVRSAPCRPGEGMRPAWRCSGPASSGPSASAGSIASATPSSPRWGRSERSRMRTTEASPLGPHQPENVSPGDRRRGSSSSPSRTPASHRCAPGAADPAGRVPFPPRGGARPPGWRPHPAGRAWLDGEHGVASTAPRRTVASIRSETSPRGPDACRVPPPGRPDPQDRTARPSPRPRRRRWGRCGRGHRRSHAWRALRSRGRARPIRRARWPL